MDAALTDIRRQKGNTVVSDETVMHGYESSTTLITDRLHYKLQTHPLIREGSPKRRAKQLSGKRKGKEKSGLGPQKGADTKMDRPTDHWSHQLNSTVCADTTQQREREKWNCLILADKKLL
jgi:hypothetical protein